MFMEDVCIFNIEQIVRGKVYPLMLCRAGAHLRNIFCINTLGVVGQLNLPPQFPHPLLSTKVRNYFKGGDGKLGWRGSVTLLTISSVNM